MQINHKKIILAMLLACAMSTPVQANNLSISNVGLASRDPNSKSLVVKFDIAWDNSWHNKINHDAVWITVRLSSIQDSASGKKLCNMIAAGVNPTGASIGNASGLEFYVPTDKKGVFLRRSSNGNITNINSQNAELTIDYNSCGFLDNDQVSVSVFGLEMVYIPQGDFYAGDYATSTASLNAGSTDIRPWHIISENAIPVSNVASNSFHYVSNGNPGEYATGASFSIPVKFPKGYNPFYVMKYEITEEQWVEFVNSLSSSSRPHRDITDANHKNSDSVYSRNTIACSGNPLVCSTERPSRAIGFLNWMDLAAFLDWAALRPMTELEFEKIARGPILPTAGEYAWGSTDIQPASNISGNENGSESVLNGNANYNNTALTGGDASQGAQYQTGALRIGIFASASSNRVNAGAGYYGVMDLSGNVAERVVSIGNSSGLIFDGQNGDGKLSIASGFEGNADVLNWPGIDGSSTHGVTGANGSGIRGGSFSDPNTLLRISDRSQAALLTTDASSNFGGRGVRSYDAN